MMKKNRTTVHDVARLAGVSISTVSVVVNKKDKYISPELRKKVEDAVATLNYQPNLVARSLKIEETKTIGLIFPNITSPVMPPLVRTVQKMAQKSDFDTFIVITEEDPLLEKKAVLSLISKRIDGLIICPVISDDNEHLRYANSLIPVVSIERRVPGFDCVVTNNKDISFKAVTHLIKHGYKRIGFISMPVFGSNTKERIEGYQQALMDNGLFNPTFMRETDFVGHSAFEAAKNLLITGQVEAIFTISQSIALGAFKAIDSLGLKIPNDVAIFGYDDVPWMEVVKPALSTIKQPITEIASKACEILFNKMDQEDNERSEIYTLDSQLIIRQSCGC
jgi:DNA-binding LacI/PurR family transcriptional regulator